MKLNYFVNESFNNLKAHLEHEHTDFIDTANRLEKALEEIGGLKTERNVLADQTKELEAEIEELKREV